ncbi:MAG: molybdopterin molybdotransferase MoeA [Chlorobium sp.]|nr:MAG: molybdopterin molybdotransferase MoeA [Chlorobium sp.]
MITTVREAQSLISQSMTLLGIEELPLDGVQGRVLAQDITAPFSLPRFTNAAMDGFALKWDDVRHASEDSPVRLYVSQKIPAGTFSTFPVVSRCCAEIMTGAPMPEGADTVVAFEESSGFGSEYVDIYSAPKRGGNVRYGGEEVAVGEILLRKGNALKPSEIAVLASFGFASVAVQRTPKVSIVTVGDEIRMPGEEVTGAQIYNCNRFMLDAACRALAVEPVALYYAPDDRKLLREALASGLDKSDILITAGGISTGEYDFVQQELSALGVKKKFWNVAQKPGKPLYFGTTSEGKAVFSLPGNPVSALVCFVKYCIPALGMLQGNNKPDTFQAILAEPFPTDKKRHRFLFGTVWIEGGKLLCRVSPKVESHMITSVVGSNCLVEAEASSVPRSAGTEVTCTLLPWASLVS